MAQIGHLVVASDLTTKTLYALQRALQLKAESDCQATVLHVVEHGLTPGIRERRQAEAFEDLDRWKRSLPEARQLGLSVHVAVGDPFAVILKELSDKNSDLAVVGQPAKHGVKDLFVGTTAERVIRFSHRPVLVVNQHAHGPYKRVLVAMDFSQGARRALECALRIAPDAEMRLVHAWQPPVWGRAADRGDTDAVNRRFKEQEQHQLEAVIEQVAPLRMLPLEMVEGDACLALTKAISAFDPDLLAMGTHSRSPLSATIVGSLAQQLLATAPCDVLVARS